MWFYSLTDNCSVLKCFNKLISIIFPVIPYYFVELDWTIILFSIQMAATRP